MDGLCYGGLVDSAFGGVFEAVGWEDLAEAEEGCGCAGGR